MTNHWKSWMYTALICVNHTPHISSLGPSVFCLLCIFATFRRSPFSFPNINGSTMPPLILNLSSATELRPRPLLRQKKTEWERSWRGKQDCKKGFERHKYISWRWLSLTVCKCSPVLQGPASHGSVVSQNQSGCSLWIGQILNKMPFFFKLWVSWLWTSAKPCEMAHPDTS